MLYSVSTEAGAGNLVAGAQSSGVLFKVCIQPCQLHLILQAQEDSQNCIIHDLFVYVCILQSGQKLLREAIK